MALTQISTAGVKDDAVTSGKIPANAVGSSEIAANAVGSSELADDAVDTNAIQDDAVTSAKLASSSVDTNALGGNVVTTANIADNAVTSAKIVNGGVGTDDLADDAVTQAKVNFPVSNRNVIINGDCLVAQRATSETSVSGSPAFTYNTVDRFVYGRSTDAVITLAQEDDAPVGFKKCLQLRVTTAATSTSYARIVYRIEYQDVYRFGFGQSGTRYLTLSFYHKHTQAGTNCVMIQNPGYNRSYIAEYTQSVANTWERATITFPVDTGNHWTPAGSRGMQIQWGLTNADAQGSANTWTSSNIVVTSNQYNHLGAVDNYFRLTGIQLELGSVATDFEHKSYFDTITSCMRYFQKVHNTQLIFSKNTSERFRISAQFAVPMRGTPSYTRTSNTLDAQGVATTLSSSNTSEAQGGNTATSDGISYSRQWDFAGWSNLENRSHGGASGSHVFNLDSEL